MKIDMFWVWMVGIIIVIMFQNYFTVKKTEWDVSYSYTTSSMEYIAYGQTALVCTGGDLDWASLRSWLVEDIGERTGEKDVSVTVLGTSKRDSDRYWRPFWKRVS